MPFFYEDRMCGAPCCCCCRMGGSMSMHGWTGKRPRAPLYLLASEYAGP